MRKLIKNGELHTDEWTLLDQEDLSIDAPPEGPVIVPLAVWQENAAVLSSRGNVSVWLNGHDDISEVKNDLLSLPIIAVNFPAFMDGRGFSTGRLLRERYGFTGELRAVGQFIRDQLCYLKRCGYNAFSLPEDIDVEGALKSLNDFSEYYQAGVDQPTPLFRRRA
ncbi:DUF934 domain-containing protein [Aurantivibrio plasticivorans]